jgi:hypothetical protein
MHGVLSKKINKICGEQKLGELPLDGVCKGMYHLLRREELSHIYVEQNLHFPSFNSYQ